MVIDLPDAGARDVARYARRSLPPYRYVPGVRPHPHRDPEGHSYRSNPVAMGHAPWRGEEWRTLDDWLYGVDLFNFFYFWEAHEAWEGLWAAAERESAPAVMLQGLIQIAAALLKTHMGVLAGARLLSRQGIDKLRHAGVIHPRMLGLDLHAVREDFRVYFEPLSDDVLPVIGAAVPVLRPT